MLSLFSLNVSFGLLAALRNSSWSLLLIGTIELAIGITVSQTGCSIESIFVVWIGLQIGYCISTFVPLLITGNLADREYSVEKQ
jgi:hypothetical protein